MLTVNRIRKPMYVKLFSSILTSSVWAEDMPTRLTWITLLAMADKDGDVRASPSGLARIANIPVEDCHRAIAKFLSPDIESGTQVYEGRRLEEREGGWFILNYAKYRAIQDAEARKATWRESSRKYRDRQHSSTESTPCIEMSTEAEAEAEADTKEKKQRPPKAERSVPVTQSPVTPKATWLTPYLNAWEAHYGAGSAATMVGRLARAFKPLDAIHGPARVLQQLGKYLHQTEARFASPQSFAQRFEQWGETVAAPTKQARGHQALAEWLHNEDDRYGNVKSGRGPAGYLATPVPEP